MSLFYIVAVGLLSFHLLHGLDSLFQTLGLRSGRWSGGLRKLSLVFCLAYFLGNFAIPGAVLIGELEPRTGYVPVTHGSPDIPLEEAAVRNRFSAAAEN